MRPYFLYVPEYDRTINPQTMEFRTLEKRCSRPGGVTSQHAGTACWTHEMNDGVMSSLNHHQSEFFAVETPSVNGIRVHAANNAPLNIVDLIMFVDLFQIPPAT